MISLLRPHIDRLRSRRELVRFIKFSIVGLINTIVDFGIYYILTRYADLFYLYANAFSWLVAVCSSFIMNKFWTFESRGKDAIAKQYVKFFSVSMGGLALSIGLLYVFVDIVGMADLLGKVFTVGIVVFWNFFVNKFWTFNNERPATTD